MAVSLRVTLAIALSAAIVADSTAAARHHGPLKPVAAAPPVAPPPAPSPPPPICRDLVYAIENSQKQLSVLANAALGDNSAPRQTMRNTESAALFQEINANIAQLGANKCPPYPLPISANAYMHSATICHIAELNAEAAAYRNEGAAPALEVMTDKCNPANWKRD
jgi:hypothetical protein